MKNLHKVSLNGATLWYSYETLVAFQLPNEAVVCSESQWTVTTAKHLNEIESDKTKRVPAGVFNRMVSHLKVSFDHLVTDREIDLKFSA